MKTVVALYANSTKAANAVDALLDKGFERDEMSVVANDADGELAGMVEDPTVEDIADAEGYEDDEGTGVAEGAGIGAVVGGLVGLVVTAGAAVIPGIGPVVAAGPLLAALGGAGIGAVAGGLIAGLTALGVPEQDAEYYAEGVRRGGTIVAVRTEDDRADMAAQIMRSFAPIDLEAEVGRWREEGWDGFDHEGDEFFTDVSELLVAGETAEDMHYDYQQGTDDPTLDSVNVPDLDKESRAYMTNLDSDSTGAFEPAPDTTDAALPDEERHPERTDEPRTKEVVEPDGDVRVYGIDLD